MLKIAQIYGFLGFSNNIADKKTPLSFRAEVTLTKSLWHMLCNKTKQIFAFLVFFHDHNGAPSQSLFTPSIMNIKEIIIL